MAELHPLQIFCSLSGSSSVLLWRRRDTLCTSGFFDDVMLSYNGGVSLPQQFRCNVVHRLTPLLHGIGCALSGRRRAPQLDESIAQGVPG